MFTESCHHSRASSLNVGIIGVRAEKEDAKACLCQDAVWTSSFMGGEITSFIHRPYSNWSSLL